jgi:hypothetical protein
VVSMKHVPSDFPSEPKQVAAMATAASSLRHAPPPLYPAIDPIWRSPSPRRS